MTRRVSRAAAVAATLLLVSSCISQKPAGSNPVSIELVVTVTPETARDQVDVWLLSGMAWFSIDGSERAIAINRETDPGRRDELLQGLCAELDLASSGPPNPKLARADSPEHSNADGLNFRSVFNDVEQTRHYAIALLDGSLTYHRFDPGPRSQRRQRLDLR